MLISGLIINGLGNWAEVATHIGTRTKEECQKHYEEVYLGVGQDEEVSGESTEMEVDGVVKKRKREFMPVSSRRVTQLAITLILAHGQDLQIRLGRIPSEEEGQNRGDAQTSW